MTNAQLAAIFAQIGDLMELKGENPFKIRAYRRAAEALTSHPHTIMQEYQAGTLKTIPGIGDAIADKIIELLETGHLRFLERLQGEVPPGLTELLEVPNLGPKTISTIYKALGVVSLDELEMAAQGGQLRTVPGLGAKSEQRILADIASLRRRSDRGLLGIVLPRAESLLEMVWQEVGSKIAKAELVGSLRRRVATIGDIDLLMAADPQHYTAILAAFGALSLVEAVTEAGGATSMARLHTGEQVGLQLVAPQAWGCAVVLSTGSKAHNARLHALAQARGYTLTDTHLTDVQGQVTYFDDEATFYEHLGLRYIPPELREDGGEIEAALHDELPELVETEELVGDLHMHSTWSDGQASILEMAQAARAIGYEYLVITDHSPSLGVANGLSVERLIQQRYEIINVNARFDDFAVLQGAEVEIRADGSLDYPDEILAQLDMVVASMHTGTRADRDTVTRRMVRAIENPHVDIIGHMTNRLLGRREGADLDMEAVLTAAAEQGTILEINASPERLDLDPTHARRALDYGCLLAVNSDAHSTDGLHTIGYGIMQARRAWAENDDIINTRPLEEFLSYIRDRSG